MPTESISLRAIESGECDLVAKAARRLWDLAGEEALVQEWEVIARELGKDEVSTVILCAIVVPRLRRIECVIDTGDLSAALDDLDQLLSRGWEVSALLPVRSLGKGHQAFRGRPIHLRGWWHRDKLGPAFASPEIA